MKSPPCLVLPPLNVSVPCMSQDTESSWQLSKAMHIQDTQSEHGPWRTHFAPALFTAVHSQQL
eukprot:1156877-Pelagomonas_calceolata.AAC.3